jgi:hypothetical protein
MCLGMFLVGAGLGMGWGVVCGRGDMPPVSASCGVWAGLPPHTAPVAVLAYARVGACVWGNVCVCVQVYVEDEFTTYAPDQPRVAGARVQLYDAARTLVASAVVRTRT